MFWYTIHFVCIVHTDLFYLSRLKSLPPPQIVALAADNIASHMTRPRPRSSELIPSIRLDPDLGVQNKTLSMLELFFLFLLITPVCLIRPHNIQICCILLFSFHTFNTVSFSKRQLVRIYFIVLLQYQEFFSSNAVHVLFRSFLHCCFYVYWVLTHSNDAKNFSTKPAFTQGIWTHDHLLIRSKVIKSVTIRTESKGHH